MSAHCELSDTCLLDDFVTSDDYDQHSLLGEWHLSAVQLATNAVGFYRAYHIKYGHKTPEELEYRIAGLRG